jgi:hypothetical protein
MRRRAAAVVAALVLAPAAARAGDERATRRRDDVERSLPTVTFVVRDEAGRDLDATVQVDGRAIKVLGRAQPVDPGTHVVRATSPGRATHEQRVAFAEGEKARLVAVTLPASDPSAPAPTAPAEAAAPAGGTGGPSRTAPWIVTGVGGGLFVLGGAIGLVSAIGWANDKSALEQRFVDSGCGAQTFWNAATCTDIANLFNQGRDRAIVRETIFFGVGGVGLITATIGVIWLVSSGGEPARVGLLPAVGPGSAGALLSGSF